MELTPVEVVLLLSEMVRAMRDQNQSVEVSDSGSVLVVVGDDIHDDCRFVSSPPSNDDDDEEEEDDNCVHPSR